MLTKTNVYYFHWYDTHGITRTHVIFEIFRLFCLRDFLVIYFWFSNFPMVEKGKHVWFIIYFKTNQISHRHRPIEAIHIIILLSESYRLLHWKYFPIKLIYCCFERKSIKSEQITVNRFIHNSHAHNML